MSQTIKLKRSSVAGKVPTTGNLDLGEIALNTNDGKVFFKKNDGTDSIQTILTTDAEITGNLYLSGSLTASSALIGPLTFPITDGTAGQFLKTDGAGNIGFVDGVSFPYTGSAIISSSLQITGSSTVTGSFSLNGYSLPEIDGDDGQVIMTNGEGTLVFNDVVKYVTVKNIETVTLPKGTPVHATSSVGNTVEVVAASASLARTMPATFVLNESLDPDQEGRAILTGFINGVNTSGFNEGDVVYVGESGGYTNVQPTGTNLIQNLGIVTTIDASNGSGYIYGSGRANATPNLLNGEVFFGEGNVSIQKPLSDILSGSSYVYSGSFSGSFEGDGSGLTGVGGIFTVSGSDVDNNQFDSEVNVLQFDSSTGLNVSQSAEGTAFVSIGSHYRDIVINGQTTLVATGSDQLELIAGDGIDLTTSTSDTNANSVSKEINFSVDGTVLRTTGDSVVSSSAQIDHDQTTNFSSDEHFTQGDITTVGTVTVGNVDAILPSGTVSSSAQLEGTFDSRYLNTTGDSVISSSAQVNADNITNFDTNVKDKLNTDGVISSSAQLDGTFLEITGDSVVSSSTQIDHDSTTNFDSNEHVDHTSVSITAGSGLTGGGTIASSRTLNVGAGDGITVNADDIEVDSTVARTNADNVFSGEQTFTDIIVNGTGSFNYIESITGSAKIIGDAYVVVNNNTPAERFAGIKVFDSGSAGVTASLEFDGETNDWFYEYSDDGGSTTDHGVVIFGPEYNTKGSPTYPSNNTLQKGTGDHHLADSNITDTGTLITLGSNTTVNGTITSTGTTLISSSTQIDHDSTTNYSSDEHFTQGDITTVGTVTSGDITGILPSGTVSASAQLTNTFLEITGDSVVSSSAQVSYTGLSNVPSGIVSSSAQVNADNVTNFDSNVKDKMNSDGVISSSVQLTGNFLEITGDSVVSSSAQIDHDQTTNYSSDEHFTQGDITTVGTVTSGDISGILPSGTVSSSAQVSYTGLSNIPSGIVSGSSQVSYTGLSNVPSGIVSSSAQVNADNVTNFDTNVKDKMNTDGVISSSVQVDHDQTTNYSSDEHFTQGDITTVGTVTSGDVSGILPSGVVSASAQLTNTFLEITGDSVISSSAQVDHDSTTNYSADEHFTQGDITTVGTVTSGDVSAILPSGVVSGSTQLTNTFLEITGDSVISSSAEGDGQGQIKLNGVNVNTNGLGTDDSPTFTNLTLSGDLTVNGTTTTVNSTEVEIGDRVIALNTADGSGDAGLYVHDTSTAETGSLLWDSTGNYWKGGLTGSEARFLTVDDEGTGNGIDADTVDGLEASQFLRSDANDTATGNITFSGEITGSTKVRFDSTLGMGTSSPESTIHIVKNINNGASLGSLGTNGTTPEIKIENDNATAGSFASLYLRSYTGDARLYATTTGVSNAVNVGLLVDSTSGAETRLFVEGESGNVGINNTSPTAKLDVSGSTNDNRLFQVGDDYLVITGSNGNVGIGTTNPEGRLHISSGTSGDATLVIEADTDNNNEGDNPSIYFKQDGGLITSRIGINGDANNAFTGANANGFYLNAASSVQIASNDGTLAATFENGNLDVEGNGTFDGNLTVNGNTTIGNASGDSFTVKTGTITLNQNAAATDTTINNTNAVSDLVLKTSGGDVRIDDDLKVSGSAGVAGDPDASYSLKVTGDFAATGEVTAYVSDERLKNVISPITEPIQKIQSLDGFYYLFNETAESIGIESGDKRHVGLSAQQVQKVLPEIVTFAPADRQDGKSKTGEDYLTIHYDKLVPLLVEGIKEQQQTIEKLQNEVKELQKVIRRA